jgi:hypothetical protein
MYIFFHVFFIIAIGWLLFVNVAMWRSYWVKRYFEVCKDTPIFSIWTVFGLKFFSIFIKVIAVLSLLAILFLYSLFLKNGISS